MGDIHRHAIDLAESADHRLLGGAHDQVERNHLAAVGMARQLQVDAVCGRVVGHDGLVCEQHDRAGRIPSDQRPADVGRVAKPTSGGVVDAGQVQTARQLETLIAQRPHAQTRHLFDPLLVARVVLMVAGDEERAEPAA